MLTNAQGSNVFNGFVRQRLLELVYEQPARAGEMVSFGVDQIARAVADLQDQLVDDVDAEAVDRYIGSFANEALGGITLTLDAGRFVFDAGEFSSVLRPLADDDGEIEGYVMLEGPLAGVTIELTEEDGEPVVELGEGLVGYTFRPVE